MNQKVLEAVQKLAARDYPQGHVIFREGEAPDNTMFFVFRGEVGIFKMRAGKEREINRLKPGTFFGEMALIHERPRLATARVTSPAARLAVMDRSVLLKLAGSSPQFLFYLLRYSVTRLLAAEDKLQRVREELQEA
ncbi:MAG: cyclic nucleotide-binding domain-containing protein, partial [Leptospiraceae bacterium]|nr:cyclic nucleotide-binding domain-containing protein [Leptospiraceae bacterium]